MSKACLDHAKGMHFDTVSSIEFELDGDYYRVECYKPDRTNHFSYAGYQRIGAYWRPITSFEQPTRSPEVLDRYGEHLMREARVNSGGELSL